MNLLIDIGNTRIKWAVSHDKGPWQRGEAMLGPDLARTWPTLWTDLSSPPEVVMVSSVAGIDTERALDRWCMEQWNRRPDYFRSESNTLGIINGYREASQLGSDRWGALLGARSLSAGALVVIDCGTAITIDVLTGDDHFLGGVILPGIELVQKSLLAGTSGILEAQTATANGILGRSTAECVASGAHYGLAGGVERVIEEVKNLLGDQPKLYLTGGNAPLVAGLLRYEAELEPDLVLLGLAEVLRHKG